MRTDASFHRLPTTRAAPRSVPASPAALVTDGEGRSVVACARSLHAAGYRVTVAASARPAPAQWSRACAERLLVPDPLRDADAFAAALAAAVSARPHLLLVPGSDASLLAISRQRALLEPHVELGLPADDVVTSALDKLWLVEHAPAAGFAAPETVVCAGADEIVRAGEALGFPLLLKPRHTIQAVGGALVRLGTALVRDAGALAQLAAGYGDGALLQAPVPGAVHSFAGVYADGRMPSSAYSRYLRTWYPDAGNAACSITLDAPGDLGERVRSLLSLLGWRGIFELELIPRGDGTFVAIDLNPRPYGSLAAAIAAGADLPATWCAWLRGAHPRPVSGRAGVVYRWEDAELKYAAWQAAHRRPLRAAAVLRPRPGAVHAHFRLDDPGPIVARAVFLARVVAARSRPSAPVVAELRVPNPAPPNETRRRLLRLGPRSPAPRVAVVGAGPYGLATAAHLRAAGVAVDVFGEPMGFWRERMPRGMVLRSRRRSSNIAHPARALTIEAFERSLKRTLSSPSLTLAEFLDYAEWYRRRAVPDVDRRLVERVERAGGVFRLTLADGEALDATHVVVAAGLAPFPHVPAVFAGLGERCSHAVDHDDLGRFAGQRVIVVGAGQSALESAALLHEGGADVEVVARTPAIYWLGSEDPNARRPLIRTPLPPTDVGGRVTGWLAAAPDAFRRLPRALRSEVSYRCIRPAGAGWLRPRVADVAISLGREVVAATAAADAVELRLDDGTTRAADHLLLATGYAVDVRRYRFLSEEIFASLALDAGYPRLRAGLESSVPRLHFVGAPAAATFGPIMRFVVGTWYAAPAVAGAVAGARRPLLRLSY